MGVCQIPSVIAVVVLAFFVGMLYGIFMRYLIGLDKRRERKNEQN